MNVNIRELLQRRLTRQLPRAEQERIFSAFLKSHNMCVLATCHGNVPRATPIEYYSDELTVYMMTDSGTKTRNIAANPLVSIGIHDPLTDWLNIRGLQMTGTATLYEDDKPEYWEAMSIYRWQNLGKDLGWTKPPRGYIIARVIPDRIEYLDISLKLKGFSERQVWERMPAGD
jgi:hypothetical protein